MTPFSASASVEIKTGYYSDGFFETRTVQFKMADLLRNKTNDNL